MSAALELRWLKTQTAKGAARRFAEFCKEDINEQSKQENFDLDKYQEAVKLVMGKLDSSRSVEEMFAFNENEEGTKEVDLNVD